LLPITGFVAIVERVFNQGEPVGSDRDFALRRFPAKETAWCEDALSVHFLAVELRINCKPGRLFMNAFT
jgi:hypothetical protein